MSRSRSLFLILIVMMIAVLSVTFVACNVNTDNACEHDYSYGVKQLPTMDSEGSLTLTCSKCDLSEEVVIPSLSDLSTWNWKVESTQSSNCEQGGIVKYTSVKPYAGIVVEIKTEAKGHKLGELIPEVPSTCTTHGVSAHKECSECGKLFDKDGNLIESLELPLADHKLGALIPEVPSTCISHGVSAHKECSECGKLFDADGKAIDSLELPLADHKLSTLVAEVPATCTSTGIKAHYTCDECGITLDADKKVITDLTIPVLSHEYGEGTVIATATCYSEGIKEFKCKHCDSYYFEYLPKVDHTSMKIEGYDATCTTDGLTDGEICSECGEELKKQEVIEATGHHHELSETIDATCISVGYKYYTCLCGDMYFETIEKIAHTPEVLEGYAPSCLEDGLTDGKYCSYCGEILENQNAIPATGHSWDDGVIDEEPTCTEAGSKLYTCENCGDTKAEEIEAKGHTPVVLEGIEATCTTVGLTEGSQCSECGEILVAQKGVSALGHDWDEGTETVSPDCTHKGEILHECSRCDATKIEYVKANGHSYSDEWSFDKSYHFHKCDNCDSVADRASHTDANKDHKCDICGYVISNCVDRDKNHECDYCGASMGNHIQAAGKHTCDYCGKVMSSHIGGTATCKDPATCTVCGQKYGSKDANNHVGHLVWVTDDTYHQQKYDCCGLHIGAKENHTLNENDICTICGHGCNHSHTIHTEELKPTCTEAGHIEYWTCEHCSTLFSDEACTQPVANVVIPAKGHNYGLLVSPKAPNCTEAGYVAHYYCSDCKLYFNDKHEVKAWSDLEIEALGHDIDKHDAKAETCESIGWNAYETCSRCDYTTYQEIPAKGHNYGDWIAEVPAKCTVDGTVGHYHCSNCNKDFNSNKELITNLVLDKLGHTPKEAVVENKQDSTCIEVGHYDSVVYCSRCQEELSRIENIEIAKKAHIFGEWIDEVPATCVATGTKGHKDCSLCKKHYDNNGIEITDLTLSIVSDAHNWSDDWTGVEEGHYHLCINEGCDKHDTLVLHTDTNPKNDICDDCGYDWSIPKGSSIDTAYTADELWDDFGDLKDKEASSDKYYVRGTIINTPSYDSNYKSWTFDIISSKDGKTVKAYSVKLSGSVTEICQNDEVVVYGYIKMYGTTLEVAFTSNVSPEVVERVVGESAVTITENENADISVNKNIGRNGDEIVITVTAKNNAIIDGVYVNNALVKVSEDGKYRAILAGDMVVSVDLHIPGSVTKEFVKVTNISTLTDGSKVLIVYESGNYAFDGSLNKLDASGNRISVNVNAGKIAYSATLEKSTFTINILENGKYTILSSSGYYIGTQSDTNSLITSTSTEYENIITIDSQSNAVINSANGGYLRYNATESDGNRRFRYYKSQSYTSQKAIAIYILVGSSSSGGECEHEGGIATCKDKAICTKCNQPYGELADHTYGDWIPEEPATCVDAGTLGHYHCSVCEKNFGENKDELTSLVKDATGVHTDINPKDDKCDICGASISTGGDAKQYFEKATADTIFKNGDIILIVYEKTGIALDGSLGSGIDKEGNHISVTISGGKIAYTDTLVKSAFTINTVSGGWSIKSSTGHYIYGKAGENKLLSSTTTANANTIAYNSIKFGQAPLQYNDATLNGDRFRYFGKKNGGQKDIVVYILVDSSSSGGETHTHTGTKTEAKPATCTEEGNIAYWTCSCGKIFTDSDCKTELTDVNKDGKVDVADTVLSKNDNHDFSEGWSYDENNHYHVCKREGCIVTTTPEAHTEGTAATCTSKATCSVCSQQYGESGSHTYGSVSYSWNEDHSKFYAIRSCSKCADGVDGHTQNATSTGVQSFVKDPAPTCTTAGCYKYSVTFAEDWASLSNGETISVSISALNHDLQTVPAKQATCVELGYEAYSQCSRCDYNTKGADIPATGIHTYGDNHKCTVCQAEQAKIYLATSANWREANAWFAAYFWDSNNNNAYGTFTSISNSFGDYECYVPVGMNNVIIIRMNPAVSTPNVGNGENWAKTGDLQIPTDGNNCYKVVNWNESNSGWIAYEQRNYWVVGTLTESGWDSSDSNAMSYDEDNNVWSRTFTNVQKGEVEFEIKVKDSYDNWFGSADGSNIKFNIVVNNGEVTIKFNPTNAEITVSQPDLIYKLNNSVTFIPDENDANQLKASATLEKGSIFEVKDQYGNSYTFENSGFLTEDNKLIHSGEYTLYLKLDSKKIWVNYSHNYGTKIDAKDASCTETGNYAYYYCADCGKYFNESYEEKSLSDLTISAKGHTYGAVSYSWNDTMTECTATRSCSVCSESVEGHTQTATTDDLFIYTQYIYCTEVGEDQYKVYFNEKEDWLTRPTLLIVPNSPVGHNIVLDTDQGTNGYTWASDYSSCVAHGKCDRTGCTHTEDVNATLNPSKFQNATCTLPELSDIGYSFSVSWANGGRKTLAQTGPALGHDFDTENWSSDGENGHYHACKRTGCTEKASLTAHADNNNDHKCDECTYIMSDCKSNAVPTVKKDETCTEDGYDAYWTCSVCGKKYSDANCSNEIENIVVRPAHGHSFTSETVHADYLKSVVNCQSPAIYYKSCANCGLSSQGIVGKEATFEYGDKDLSNHIGEEKEWIPIDGENKHKQVWKCCGTVIVAEEAHTLGEDGICTKCKEGCSHNLTIHYTSNDANCTESGNIEYWSCNDCNKNFSDEECTTPISGSVIIKALGHNIVLDTTKGVGGYTWADYHSSCTAYGKCNNTGCSHTTTVTATLSLNTIQDATCTQPEKSDIDYSFSVSWANGGRLDLVETKPALGHIDENKDHSCDRGCGESMGTHEGQLNSHNCAYCGNPASDHTGGTATCKTQATCTICNEKYGDLNSSNHEKGLVWTKTETKHTYAYECCGVISVAEEVHEWSNGACTECEYECTHTGGTATCTEKAQCTICGEKYGSINPENHDFSTAWSSDETFHYHECKRDGCEAIDSSTRHADDNNDHKCDTCGSNVSEHSYTAETASEDRKASNATCTAKATYYYSCSICGESENNASHVFESGEYSAHNYGDWTNEVSATCSAPGSKGHKDCSVCEKHFDNEGNVIEDLTLAIDPTAHNYGDWSSNDNGTHSRTCSHNSEHIETVNCSGGTATCTTQAICSVCSQPYGEYSAHNYGTASYSWNDAKTECTATRSCSVCTETASGHKQTATATVDSSVTQNATCVLVELSTKTATFTETWAETQTVTNVQTDLALGHDGVKTEAKSATCTATGNIDYWTCSRCNKIFSDEACTNEITSDDTVIAIVSTAHNYVAVTGVSNLYKCSYCNKEFKIDSSTSTWSLLTDVSNLTVGSRIIIVGINDGSYYALSTNQKTSNRGAVAVTIATDVTLTIGNDVQIITLEEGNKANTFAFKVGDVYLYAASSSKNNLKTETTLSDNGSWTITINTGVATIKAQGTNTHNLLKFNSNDTLFACYASGQNDVYIYIENVTYTEIEAHTCADNVTGATCTEDGTCSICGRTVENSKLGHDFANYVYNNDATCTVNGTKTATCSRDNCDETITIADDEHLATGHNYNNNGECQNEGCNSQCNVVYLDTNVWNVDNAWFAAYFWKNNSSENTWVEMQSYSNSIYYAFVPNDVDMVIFCRMNKDKSELSWESKWNQSSNISLELVGNKAHYTVVAYGEGEADSIVSNSYTAAGGISDDNGGLFGTAWKTDSTDNALVFNPNTGLYYKLFENVTADGTYNFKVVVNQAWTLSYGANGENVSFTVSQGDNVMLTFDFFTKEVKAEIHHHSYTYTNNGTDHSKTCCGDPITESHSYTNGYCVCGAIDPEYYFPKNISDLNSLDDGTKVEFTGTVTEINTAWNNQYNNISVTVSDDNGNTFYIYRLATNVALCDEITVKGVIGTYNSSKQISADATATISTTKNHTWENATCTAPKTCSVCDATEGDPAGHKDENNDNKCDSCSKPMNIKTVTVSIETLATNNNWVNATAYPSIDIDSVIKAATNSGGNNSKYYSSDYTWRFYNNGKLTITAKCAKITSITFTTTKGSVKYGEQTYSSNVSITIDNLSEVELTFTETCQISSIKVEYYQVEHSTLTKVDASDSTCISQGNIEYWECPNCGKKFSDSEGNTSVTDISKPISTTHTQKADSYQNATSATCTEEGNYEYYQCSVCNKYVITKDENTVVSENLTDTVIGKVDHTTDEENTYPASEPTCKNDGNIAYYYCTVCKKYYKVENNTEVSLEEVRIPANGIHVDTDGDGKCNACGDDMPTTGTKLDTPVLSIDNNGKVTWTAVTNATEYKYQVKDKDATSYGNWTTIATTATLEVTLTDGQSINVVAVGDNNTYIDSDPATETYTASSSGTTTSLLATFNLGTNGTSTHNDGSSTSSYSESNGGYTLTLSSCTNVYKNAIDAKGNGALKLGTSSKTATFTFEVGDNIKSVKIYVAGYKTNTAKININGSDQTISTKSNDGSYTAITVDTSTNKTITLKTTTSAQRCMIDKIEFYGVASSLESNN